MKTARSLNHHLRDSFRQEELDRDLSDELAAHLEIHIADNLRAGMSPEEARSAARADGGDVRGSERRRRRSHRRRRHGDDGRRG